MTRRGGASVAVALGVAALIPVVLLGGCARGGTGGSVMPSVVIDFYVRFAGPVNDNFYYFIPIDTDGDLGADGPLPVAAGPYWENGWGTGSFSHYVEYHQGQYNLYKVNLDPHLNTAGAGITSVSGVPAGADAGTHVLTLQSLALGSVTVTGTGMVQSVANTGFQSAGTIALSTDASGRTVANSVTYAAAPDGGRALTTAEQAALDALNAGGVALAPDSLSALGLTLTLGPPAAGQQLLAVGPTVGTFDDTFTAAGSGQQRDSTVTLTANSSTATSTPPIPGLTITTGDLTSGSSATIELTISVTATLLGPPFDYTLPAGGDTLRATVDLASLGQNIPNLSVNFISTTELIFDPTITDPNQHTYDGLGRLGNRYVTFRTTQFQTINNSSGLFEQEQPGDSTLEGPATQQQRNSVDIVDWSITIRSLG